MPNLKKMYKEYLGKLPEGVDRKKFENLLNRVEKSGDIKLLEELESKLSKLNGDFSKFDNVVKEFDLTLTDGVAQVDILKLSGLDKGKFDEIVSIPKGSRPDPSTYLSEEYIKQHLKKFKNSGSFVMTKKQYMRFVGGNPYIGCPDNTQFIAPKDFMYEIDNIARGDMSIYEKNRV